MTYQALSQENDNIELSSDQSINLAHSIVNTLNEVVTKESEYSSYVSDRVNDALDVTFKLQDETEKFIENEPRHSSTPLSKQEVNQIYEQQKEDYLKATLEMNAKNLDAVAERAKIDNEKLYQEIVNPHPGLVLDNKIDVDETHEINLSNATQKRLNKTLEQGKEKINSSHFPAPIINRTPNNSSFTEKNSIVPRQQPRPRDRLELDLRE